MLNRAKKATSKLNKLVSMLLVLSMLFSTFAFLLDDLTLEASAADAGAGVAETPKTPVSLDLTKGPITINNDYCIYYDANGTQKSIPHSAENNYVITSGGVSTSNEITLSGTGLVCTLTLENVNTTGNVNITKGSGEGKNVVLMLSGTNTVGRVHYSGNSKLYITSADGDGQTTGTLNASSGNASAWLAAIGSGNGESGFFGLTIAGGTINATATAAAAIGGGGNGNVEILITGGIVNATNQGNSAALGGGGSNDGLAGYGKVTIIGGTVTVTNNAGHGAAIGGGGVNGGVAGKGIVRIEGGNVTAIVKGRGAAIGGGGSAVSAGNKAIAGTAGDGEIFISGASTVVNATAKEPNNGVNNNNGAAIGGGGASSGQAGKGIVRIEGGTVTATMKGTGACIGGGGASKETLADGITVQHGNAGDGEVVITGGTVTAADGYILNTADRGSAIGGGSCFGTGAAGKGTVTILGGTVTANSRGRGATIGSGGTDGGTTQEGVIAISGDSTEVFVVNNGSGVAIGSGCIDTLNFSTDATPGDAHISITNGAVVNAAIIVKDGNVDFLKNKYVISAGSNPAPGNGAGLPDATVFGTTFYETDATATVAVGYKTNFTNDFFEDFEELDSAEFIAYDPATPPTLTPMILDLAQGHVIFKEIEEVRQILQYKISEKDADLKTWDYEDDREFIVLQTNPEIAVNYRIAFVGDGVTYDVTIHNINSRYLDSILVQADEENEKHVTIRLSGDNKINNLMYYTYAALNPGAALESSLTITNAEGTEGKLTVRPENIGTSSLRHGAAIGGRNEGGKTVTGLRFEGGIVEVYADEEGSCTAIGGGGNGYAEITVAGGTVYAESWSSGASIGGGLAFTGSGSYADITVSGGSVTAINHGTTNHEAIIEGVLYGTAIGGGSSYKSGAASAKYSTINITGGEVYAMVTEAGYTAIGGGNSHNGSAGNAEVTISGGRVVCDGNLGGGSSVEGDGGWATVSISANCSVTCTGSVGGGGTVDGNGGTAEVTIGGGFGSIEKGIGGGYSTSGQGGTATVRYTDGTFSTSSIGGGYSVEQGYSTAEVTITGGSLNGYMAAYPENDGGMPVYLTTITLIDDPEGNFLTNHKVSELEFLSKITYLYGLEYVRSDDRGKVYLWLPEDLVEVVSLTTESGKYTANVPIASEGTTNKTFKVIFMTEVDGEYEIWLDDALTESYDGAVVVKKETNFVFYVETHADYHLNVQILHSPDGVKQVEDLSEEAYGKVNTAGWKTNQYDFDVTSDTIVLITYGPQTGYNTVFDLTQGNVVVDEVTGGFNVTYGGYEIQNISGQFLLTTGARSTKNTVTVNSGFVKMRATNLMVENAQSVFHITGGTLDLTADYHDNQISSTGQEAIRVDEGAKLNITLGTGDSLKILGSEHAIAGLGAVNLTETAENAHLQFGATAAPVYSGGFSYTTGYAREEGWTDAGDTLLNAYSPNIPTEQTVHLYGFIEKSTGTLYPTVAEIPAATAGETYTAHTIRVDGTINPSKTDFAAYVYGLPKTPAILTLTQNGEKICVVHQLDDSQNQNAEWYDSTAFTLTVLEASRSGELVLTVTEKIEYDVKAEDVRVTYNGALQFFSIVVNTPNAPAAEYRMDGDPFTGKKDAAVYRIDWTVPESEYYYEKTGTNTLTILQATNEWRQTLSCAGTVAGVAPKPSAIPLFGESNEITYLYFDSNKNLLGGGTEAPTGEGNYFVQAKVVETTNYTGLTSELVPFAIGYAYSNVLPGRLLDQIGASTQSVTIASKGAATALVGIDIEALQLYLKASLGTIPAGTEITLIRFEDSGVSYYFYKTASATTLISLTSFLEMGTTSSYFKLTATERVTVQLCLCFPEATGNLNLFLTYDQNESTNSTGFQITFDNAIAQPSGSVSVGSMEVDEDESISTTVTVSNLQNLTANLSDSRRINPTLADYRAYLAVHLYRDGTEIAIPDGAVVTANGIPMTLRGGIAITEVTNKDYDVKISGLFGGSYHIKVELCAENEDAENVRALILQAPQESASVLVVDKQYALLVTMDDPKARIVDASAAEAVLTLRVRYSASRATDLSVFSQYKANPSELLYYNTNPQWGGSGIIPLTETEGEAVCHITVPMGTEPGTYSIAVVFGDITYNYNILVK